MSIDIYKPTHFMLPDSYYDKLSADIAVTFISCLRYPSGKSFNLTEWQEQIVRDLFGVKKATGLRQFRYSYAEIPKIRVKRELVSAIALLLTCADREPRAEVYSCTSDRQQASILFDVVCDMIDQCRELRRFIKPVISQKRLIYKPLNSFYQMLSPEDYPLHELNVHSVIFDGIHAQSEKKFFDIMTRDIGVARKQPLYLIITSGSNENSIYWNQYQKAKDLLEEQCINPSFHPVIYSTKPEDDWSDEKA